MRHPMTIGIAGLALLVAAPAYAACPGDIDQLRTELRGDQGFQQRYKQGQIDDAAYRRLFEAARTFSDNGLQQRCEEVLAGIRDLSNKADASGTAQPQDQQQRSAERPRTGQPPGGMQQPRTADRDRSAMLQSAKPITQASMTADLLVGADVRNTQDEDLGDVSDVVMEQGKLSSIIVGSGGFLGMGVSYYRLALDKAKIALPAESEAVTDRNRAIVVVQMSEEQLEALPKVEERNGRWVAAGSDQERSSPPATRPAAPPSDGTRQQ